MPPDVIRQAVGEMEKMLVSQQVDGSDLKAKAKTMRATGLFSSTLQGSQPPSPYTQFADLVYNMRHQETANERGYPRVRAIPEPSVSR